MCSMSAVRFLLPVHIFNALIMDNFSCVSFSGKRKILSSSSSIFMFKQADSITDCLDSRTARLTLFCNSRTFPGHPYESSSCSASQLNPLVCRLSSLENFSLKCSASGRMSSGHSCRAGRTISNSPRRWYRSSRKRLSLMASCRSSLVAATILTSECFSLLLPIGI